jgi:hypothetical protein
VTELSTPSHTSNASISQQSRPKNVITCRDPLATSTRLNAHENRPLLVSKSTKKYTPQTRTPFIASRWPRAATGHRRSRPPMTLSRDRIHFQPPRFISSTFVCEIHPKISRPSDPLPLQSALVSSLASFQCLPVSFLPLVECFYWIIAVRNPTLSLWAATSAMSSFHGSSPLCGYSSFV